MSHKISIAAVAALAAATLTAPAFAEDAITITQRADVRTAVVDPSGLNLASAEGWADASGYVRRAVGAVCYEPSRILNLQRLARECEARASTDAFAQLDAIRAGAQFAAIEVSSGGN